MKNAKKADAQLNTSLLEEWDNVTSKSFIASYPQCYNIFYVLVEGMAIWQSIKSVAFSTLFCSPEMQKWMYTHK